MAQNPRAGPVWKTRCGTRMRWFISYTSRRLAIVTTMGSAISRGLVQRLDYLQDLGVDTLWLLPFYPSPLRDDGYDISDYQNVHPQYGTLADFRAFVCEAHARGLKIITELVINHTSDQHPWFQGRARAARFAGAEFLRLERRRQEISGNPHHLHRHRNVQLGLGPGGAAVLLASLFAPAGLNHNNPAVVKKP